MSTSSNNNKATTYPALIPNYSEANNPFANIARQVAKEDMLNPTDLVPFPNLTI